MADTSGTVAQAMAGFPSVGYALSTLALTVMLVWGLRMLGKELQQPAIPGAPTALRQALTEKNPAAPAIGGAETQTTPGDVSFSRVAGALGAIGIAATFVGIGYWILHALFFDIAHVRSIDGLSAYFLAGSALFMPYAFNQLASVFRP
jgi:hypothetical protein